LSFVYSRRQTHSALVGLMALGLLVAGCRQIAGIEKRSFGGDGGAGEAGSDEFEPPTEAQCAAYCGKLLEGCNETTSEVYAYRKDTKYCEALCPYLSLSNDDSLAGNTFECRDNQAQLALNVASDRREGQTNCRAAGAGGNGKCGSNCESYCQLYERICSQDGPTPRSQCLEECKMLRDDPSVDAENSFSNQVDTVQCRLTHLGAAALGDRGDHCEHASIYVDKNTPCYPPNPRCADYCDMVMKVCRDDSKPSLKQYDSESECLTVCNKGMVNSVPLVENETQDKTHDTLACRRYHTYNSFLIGESHCTHSGPSGDGHCGRICPAYCKLAKDACGAAFTTAFKDDAGCLKDCAALIKIEDEEDQLDLGYSVAMGAAGGNTIQCRIYHAVKAFSKASECTSALGGGDCAP
jgi:hypothetical protein